ncbi:MAG: GIY-YIG nuclease family protein [Candidatus Binatia bacterium]|nr:GIY-YIG nuclease family protein [Candidatus Binatia bacterium]
MQRHTLVLADHAPRFAAVPQQAGVYEFRDGTGASLYVGKSKNLRRRLQSYFTARHNERRKATMVKLFAATVHYELTGSDFAAMLRELELVQQLRPRFNRRMRHPERYAYVAIDFRLPFPRLVLTNETAEGHVFLGPFAARSRMRAALEQINDAFGLRTCGDPLPDAVQGKGCWRYRLRTCLAPCQGNVSPGEYGRALLRAVRTLTGSSHALREWEQRRTELSEALAFERAQRLWEREVRVRSAQRLLHLAMRRGDNALVIQPGVAPDSLALWAICDGDVASRTEVPRNELHAAFRRTWEALSAAAPREVSFVRQEDLDRRWIIYRWLRTPEGREWSVPLARRTEQAVWDDVSARAARLFTSPVLVAAP